MDSPTLADLLFPRRDASFAATVARLSEPESGRPADNLVSNEDSVGRVAARLDAHDAGGAYVGVGPDQNFTLIAHARPRVAVVLDFRRRNALYHLALKALFALSPDRATFLGHWIARRPAGPIPPDAPADDLVRAFVGVPLDRATLADSTAAMTAYLRAVGGMADCEWADLATIRAKLAGPGLNARFLALPMYPTLADLIRSRDHRGRPAHFLADDASFRVVRDLQVGDRLLPVVGDFAGPTALPKIGAWLRRAGLRLAVFYASDVEFFLLRSGQFAAYVANLAGLPWRDDALIVRTSTREIDHPERHPGDSSTTIARPAADFLRDAQAGRIRSLDDLFR